MPNFIFSLRLDARDLEIFGDRIGEQSLTHLARRLLGRVAIAGVHLDDDVPADVHVAHGAEAEGVQRVSDGAP